MSEYAPLVEGDVLLQEHGGSHGGQDVFAMEDLNQLKEEQLVLLQRIGAPLRSVVEIPLDRAAPESVSGYCLCQNRFDRWKRYFVELRGTQLVIKNLKKGTGEASRVKTVMDVRFVTFNPLSLSEKEGITAANLSTDCMERFRIFAPTRTRVIVPASASDFEQWSSALHSLLETHLDSADLERRREMSKEVEPIYQRAIEAQQKKGSLILAALGHAGMMDSAKKDAIRQGVLKMQSDSKEWKKTFFLLKPNLATYHESKKHHKKGFINLKLARVEIDAKSEKRFKIITPMATYTLKARHDVDSRDWVAAITAASQGKKTYDGAREGALDLDAAVPAFSKPYVVVKQREYKLKDLCVIGRSSACTVCITDDKKISREHAKIENRNGKWVLLDMGSHSGTRLNGMKVTQHILKPGDLIEVGTTAINFKASTK